MAISGNMQLIQNKYEFSDDPFKDKITEVHSEISQRIAKNILEFLNPFLRNIPDLSLIIVEYLNISESTELTAPHYLVMNYTRDLTRLMNPDYSNKLSKGAMRLEIGNDFCIFSYKNRSSKKGFNPIYLVNQTNLLWRITECLFSGDRFILDGTYPSFLNYKSKNSKSYVSLNSETYIYLISALYSYDTPVKVLFFKNKKAAFENGKVVRENSLKWGDMPKVCYFF